MLYKSACFSVFFIFFCKAVVVMNADACAFITFLTGFCESKQITWKLSASLWFWPESESGDSGCWTRSWNFILFIFKLNMYLPPRVSGSSPGPPESDVSVDRRAARGHETLNKGHACPFAGKSSMHSFPAIVLRSRAADKPGAGRTVSVLLWPNLASTHFFFFFLSIQIQVFSLSPLHTFHFRLFLSLGVFSSLLPLLWLCISLALVTAQESGRPDKSLVAVATAKWPDSPPTLFFLVLFSTHWAQTGSNGQTSPSDCFLRSRVKCAIRGSCTTTHLSSAWSIDWQLLDSELSALPKGSSIWQIKHRDWGSHRMHLLRFLS